MGFESQAFLRGLSTQPGVYRMLDEQGDVLYVGKARNLKKRVASYFLRASGNPRIEAMVDRIADIQVTITASEDEALLLESSLIKSLRPRYNVCLRDDKSYPLLRLTAQQFPRLMFHRGRKRPGETYFGPFPSAATVRETATTLQKVFRLRNCSDSYFANRSRPCLQHQIERCSAPCVGAISTQDYAQDVRGACDVMQGKAGSLVAQWQQQMDQAAARLEFESAARYRDRIAMIRRMQEQHSVTGLDGDVDLVALRREGGTVGIAVLRIRDGQHRGQVQHFPQIPEQTSDAELMASFLAQHYTSHEPPRELVVDCEPEEAQWLLHALAAQAGHPVSLKLSVRGTRRRLLSMTQQSLDEALKQRLLSRRGIGQRLLALQQRFDLPQVPQHLECFDISHSSGEATVASCVVFDAQGAKSEDYRRYNIQGISPGDDYAAIAQAVARRYARVAAGEFLLADVVLIDGGKGQLAAAQAQFEALSLQPGLLLGVAKGSSRKPGLEQLFLSGVAEPLRLDDGDPALHLIQQIRDEAHRFAITGHRRQRGKARTRSELDEVAGLGPKRRQSLLRSFGGMRQLRRASREDIAKVTGISGALAARVYDYLHEQP